MPRIIGWFSQGAASATAIKLAIEINKSRPDPLEFVVANIYIKDEYDDGGKFNAACEDLFGQPIVNLRADKYNASVDTVIEKTRYMSGPSGARCTKELKKNVRLAFQRHDDIHVFGLDVNEAHRVDQLLDTEPELDIWTPLIDAKLSKADCFAYLSMCGIELPMMYQLGYHNNNCIGCLKAGGAGYWNKIRKDFPGVFAKRAEQERLLGVSMVKMSEKVLSRYAEYEQIQVEELMTGRPILKVDDKGRARVPLRFLPPDAGSHKDLDIGSCGFFCERGDWISRP